jgi:hypothetical protein
VKIKDKILLSETAPMDPNKNLITALPFGFITGKYSVDHLCPIMNDPELKKGTGIFLLLI